MLTFIKENAFLILGLLSLGFLLVYGIIQNIKGVKGTWSDKITSQPAPKLERKEGFESRGEKRTREFLESYFGRPFTKARPDFLNNDVTGGRYNMEIDCFNEELKLGVEYNGQQHYNYIPYFHATKDAFYNQKYRDKLKKIYCMERGITLIEIPYTQLNNLEAWLKTALEEHGFINKPI